MVFCHWRSPIRRANLFCTMKTRQQLCPTAIGIQATPRQTQHFIYTYMDLFGVSLDLTAQWERQEKREREGYDIQQRSQARGLKPGPLWEVTSLDTWYTIFVVDEDSADA